MNSKLWPDLPMTVSTPSQLASVAESGRLEGGRRLHANNLPMPLLTVLTVVFNGSEQLASTMDSVLAQRRTDVEYLVIDGGSTDGTLKLFRHYEDRLDYWLSEPDRGIYDAMNKGLRLARGEYVYFLNAGDTLAGSDTLQEVIALLDRRPTILMNRVRAVDGAGVRLFPKAMGLTNARETFMSAYCHQAAFVRRDAYLDVGGFDLAYRHFADFKALWKIRTKAGAILQETSLEVAEFPLDGVSSDWRRATELTQERERLLAELGDPSNAWQYQMRVLRARLYTMRMKLRHRLRQCS